MKEGDKICYFDDYDRICRGKILFIERDDVTIESGPKGCGFPTLVYRRKKDVYENITDISIIYTDRKIDGVKREIKEISKKLNHLEETKKRLLIEKLAGI